MKFLDQLGDAVKDVKELAKSKASVVKDLTADAAQEVKILAKEKAKDVKAKSADAAHDVNELVKEKSAGAAKDIRAKVAETTSEDKTSGK